MRLIIDNFIKIRVSKLKTLQKNFIDKYKYYGPKHHDLINYERKKQYATAFNFGKFRVIFYFYPSGHKSWMYYFNSNHYVKNPERFYL